MRQNIIALILSFLCCGLGQIYNRQILKGIDLIIIYLSMITLAIFSSRLSISYMSRSLILSIISFMWIIGMIDAFIDGEWYFIRRKLVLIYIIVSILPSVFIIAFSSLRNFYSVPKIAANDSGEALISTISSTIQIKNDSINGSLKVNEKPETPKLYIQVAALKKMENVANLRKRLEKKGYNVVVEPVKLKDEFFYKVIIDGIQDEEVAKFISERLTIEENINVIIHRR